ncbi:MAG: hypothetical protein HW387_201 [Parachlamydiales bacterium]|nr:hypothetical protein [Parachlamydiales bacterium]
MICAVPSAEPRTKVFDSFPACLGTIQTLARIQMIDALALKMKTPRDKVLITIQNAWKTALEWIITSKPLPDVKNEVERKLNCYYDLYDVALETAQTAEQVSELAHRALSDINSIPANPVIKSFHGKKGPTFLVSFVEFDPIPRSKACVLKWADPNELWGNRLFDRFSFCPTRGKEWKPSGYGFAIPSMGWIDFESHDYVTANGQILRMDSDREAQLKADLQCIAINRCDSDPFATLRNKVMFTERIFGGTLFDFAFSQYSQLPEPARMKLLGRLARLSLLDVLAGNLDRLIPIAKTDDNGYQFDIYEANIANVLVVVKNEKCKIFAIDNEINLELIENPEDVQKYQAFLITLFSSPDFHNQLATVMIDSIQSAITGYLDDADKIFRQQKVNFNPFLLDLKTHSEHISSEFLEMSIHLQEMLSMYERESDFFSTELLQGYPALTASVWNRLNILKNLRLIPCCQSLS